MIPVLSFTPRRVRPVGVCAAPREHGINRRAWLPSCCNARKPLLLNFEWGNIYPALSFQLRVPVAYLRSPDTAAFRRLFTISMPTELI